MTLNEIIALKAIEQQALSRIHIERIPGLDVELHYRKRREEWVIEAYDPTPQQGRWVMFLVSASTPEEAAEMFNSMVQRIRGKEALNAQ